MSQKKSFLKDEIRTLTTLLTLASIEATAAGGAGSGVASVTVWVVTMPEAAALVTVVVILENEKEKIISCVMHFFVLEHKYTWQSFGQQLCSGCSDNAETL